MVESPQPTTLSKKWRPALIIAGVIVIDLVVVTLGHLSAQEYRKRIDAAEARELASRPQPHLYTATIAKYEAADGFESKIDLIMVVFTTLGIFVAGKQTRTSILRSTLVRTAYGLLAIESLLLLTIAVLFVEFDAWRVGDFSDHWLGWLSDMVNAGWFGFVLLRLVLLVLAALTVRWLWRWSHIVGAVLGVFLITGLTIFCVRTSYSPAGVYGYVDEIEKWPPDEDYYFVFRDGKAKIIRIDEIGKWGDYEKTTHGWVLTQNDHSRYKLKSSWFGIWQCDVEFPDHCSFLGRRILPFLRPGWMPQWLQ